MITKSSPGIATSLRSTESIIHEKAELSTAAQSVKLTAPGREDSGAVAVDRSQDHK